jgi:hypothetical protein
MIIAMFIITEKVEYLFGMLFINFFVPVVSDHIPKIRASINVNSMVFMPYIKPDSMVINVNTEMVVVWCDVMALVIFLYQFDFIVMLFVLACSSGNIYPGVHSAEKPNGMLQKIFHVGMLKFCIRRNFRKIFESSTPTRYKNTKQKVVIVMMNVGAEVVSASISLNNISWACCDR